MEPVLQLGAIEHESYEPAQQKIYHINNVNTRPTPFKQQTTTLSRRPFLSSKAKEM
jgi:hypothetical protein